MNAARSLSMALVCFAFGAGCQEQSDSVDSDTADQTGDLVTTCIARREVQSQIGPDGTEVPGVDEDLPIQVVRPPRDAGPARTEHRVKASSRPIALIATLVDKDPDRVEILLHDKKTDLLSVTTGAFGTDFDGTVNPLTGRYASAQWHLQTDDGRDDRIFMVCCQNTSGTCENPL